MSRTELNAKIKELRELRRMADELATEIETITDAVKQEMQVQGVDALTGDDWRATWKTVQSSRFDSKTFKIAQPDLYDAFVHQVESRRFVLA